LAGDAIQIVLYAVDRGVAVLDLSEVNQIDDAAVRAMAEAPHDPGMSTLARAVWLARVRGGGTRLS
jgi:hypothetical protein